MATHPVTWKRGFKKLADCEILGQASNSAEASEIIKHAVPADVAGSRLVGVELLDRAGEVAWEPKFSALT